MSFKDRPFFRRILQFDDLMRRGRPVTCTSLARSWETSTKTVQRFVEQMRDDFDAPVEFDRAKRSYRYTDASFRLPWLPVEGKDLFAIGVAMKVFQIYEGTPVKEDLKAVFERLKEMMPREIRVNPSSLVERLYIHPAPLRLVTPRIWDAVCDALRDQTVLEIDYRKPAKAAARRPVEPYSLVLANGDWLLLAKDPGDGDTGKIKTFYLSRIVEARPTKQRFVRPKTFDPAEYFGERIGIFVDEKPFRFRVRISKEAAGWASEVRWHPTEKLRRLPGGAVEIDLPAGSLWEARRFVLSFGSQAKALSPRALVQDIAKEAAAMKAAYR